MQSQTQPDEYENIRLLSYLQATAETFEVPVTRQGDPKHLNMYMTQAMQHQDLGIVLLTPPLQKSTDVKEALENESEQSSQNQIGEGFAISCVQGAPTTDNITDGEEASQSMQILAQEWSQD